MSQRMMSQFVERKSVDTMSEDDRGMVRLNSATGTHAGDWLMVIPSPTLGLQLRAQEFRVSALYRLGKTIYGREQAPVWPVASTVTLMGIILWVVLPEGRGSLVTAT